MKKIKKYTKEEKEFFQSIYKGKSYREIQELFNAKFPEHQITIDQVKSFLSRYKLNTGRTGQFSKGHVPFNKGKKMSEEQYTKSAPTMFKKGHIPANKKPIGYERINVDGYIEKKVRDTGRKNFELKQRLVWEEANGKIPDTHIIVFLDGNKLNCDLSNLAMVSRKEHQRMNLNRRYSKNPEVTKSFITLSKMENLISNKEKQKKEEKL